MSTSADDLARVLAPLLAAPDRLAAIEARLARIEEAQRPRAAQPAPGASAGDLLGTEEAAALARVKPATVREWVRMGRLLAVRAPGSRRLRVRRGDLVAYLQGFTPEAAQESAGLDALAGAIVNRRKV